ncbi:MAG: hypothetical protein QM299_03480 [Pseudomonadota bacterium]|nr:hypothetical protein [Pseudomonadota bacterium]
MNRRRNVRKSSRPSVNPSARTPLQVYDPLSCIMRFILAALFGVFIDIVLICLYGAVILMGYRPGFNGLFSIMAAVPLIWGALGVFFFNEMLDLATEIVERFFLFWR